MAQTVTTTGASASVSGPYTGDFLHYIRDTDNAIIDDTDDDGIRDTDAPIFTATGTTAAADVAD